MCKNYNIEVMIGASNATKKKRFIMLFKPHNNRGWTMVDRRHVTKIIW